MYCMVLELHVSPGVDLIASCGENGWKYVAFRRYNAQEHLLQDCLSAMAVADIGVHISHRT
jgi:hypothetical protein